MSGGALHQVGAEEALYAAGPACSGGTREHPGEEVKLKISTTTMSVKTSTTNECANSYLLLITSKPRHYFPDSLGIGNM